MFNNNPMNPLQRPKVHSRSNRLSKKKTKRYKLYWSRSTSSSGSAGVVRIKPKVAGLTLYIWLGGGGSNSIFYMGGTISAPTLLGTLSAVGTNNIHGNIIVAPPGRNGAAGTRYDSGVVGISPGPCVRDDRSDPDPNLWSSTTWVSNNPGLQGAWYAIYDSWNTPGSVRVVSAYNGVSGGPGSSGYNDYAQNDSSYPAIGGYVRIRIV